MISGQNFHAQMRLLRCRHLFYLFIPVNISSLSAVTFISVIIFIHKLHHASRNENSGHLSSILQQFEQLYYCLLNFAIILRMSMCQSTNSVQVSPWTKSLQHEDLQEN